MKRHFPTRQAQKQGLKGFVRLCAAAFIVTNWVACAATQQEKEASIVQNRATMAEQEANATRFVEALFRQQTDVLREAVDMPFYYNQQAILAYPQEWDVVLQQLRSQTIATEDFNILSTDRMLAGELLGTMPKVWAKLLEYRFDTYTYLKFKVRQPLSAEAQLKDPKGRRFVEGQILLIVDPQSAKVRGFIL
jgi:hypothetical protein